jgi:pimeloyl-ACP methyl ester carboxylesterase
MRSMSKADYQPRRARRVCRHSIRGIDYAVHEWGDPDRRLLVCLHGWGDTGAGFQFLADELGEDWYVVAPDWRGFGESSANVGTYFYPDYIADLDALLGVYSPARAADILGHSMGGNIAGLYAGTFPDRVAAFVNVEGFGLEDADPDEAPGRYRRWIERQRQAEAFSDYPDFEALAARLLQRNPGMGADRAAFVAGCWAVERDGRVVLRADPRHRLPNPILYRRAEAEACWRRVEAPVLMVAGEDSAFLDRGHPQDGAFDFDLPFPDVTSVLIPAAGHMLHFEAPEALARHTRDFLDKNV